MLVSYPLDIKRKKKNNKFHKKLRPTRNQGNKNVIRLSIRCLWKIQKKEDPFSDMEKRTKDLLRSFVDGPIGSRDFAVALDDVRVEFYKLVIINGKATIDEDIPLWMNSFFGFHFLDWYRFQQVKWYFEDHPEELTDERREKLDHLKSNGYDEKFLEICNTILKELVPINIGWK